MFTHHKIGQKQKQRKNTLLFITGLFLFLFGLLTTMNCNVRADNATILSPGDIFVVTANGNADFIEIVTKKEINAGTTIYLSDNAWKADNTRRTGEGTIIFTSITTIPAGTVISIENPHTNSPTIIPNTLGTVSRNGNFDLATAGDQILIYQGTLGDPNPSRIYGFGFATANSWITSGSPSVNNSYLPGSLSTGSSAFAFTPGARKSVQYSCTNRALFSDTFVDDFHNISNWEGNTDAGYFGPISCDFDATKPIATIDLASGQSSLTTSMTGKFLVTFSEAINTSTFTCDDIDFVGTAPGQTCISIDEVAPYNDTTFEVTTTASNDGSIITKINANKVTDIAGNPNGTSNTINNAITIDRSSLRLSPGDIVIVTANAHPDFFEFLVNKQLDPGTVIYFSDNAWQEDDSRRTGEGTIVFTSTTIIPAGTVISVQTPEITPTLIQNTLGTVSRINDFNLAVNGDNILIYQGNSHDDPNPKFIYGIGFGTTSPRISISDPGANKSYLPSSLTLGENTLNYNKTHRNIQYTCAIRGIYNENFNTYITDITNWTGNALSGSTFGPIVCDFDASRPQATITLADGQSADTTGTIGKFLFTFSEAINTGTFTCEDISLDGTASNKQCTNIEEVSPNNGTSFEVSVSATSTGTIIVDLDENKVEDLAKNPNSASITTENTIQFLEDSPALIYNVYLTYTAGANGALSGNANQTLSAGEDGTAIEAIADSGYYFIQRSDGRTDNPRTDLNVTADISVSATFIANSATTYNLTYSAGANGIVSGNLTQTVEENSDGSSVEAIADTGYHFVQRSDSRTDNPRTDLNVTADISVIASFEADAATTYNLTYSAGANGIVSGNLTQTVDQHNNGTPVRAIADDGYHFKQRSDGNTDNPRIDLNVTTNISVSAMFEIDESTDYVSNNSNSAYLSKDRCPGGDLSPSYYDGYCGEDPKLDETTHGSATKEKYVYYPPIKRYQLAMFVGKIANSLLTLNANDIECDFEDIKYLDNDTKAYIVHSCKHGIMGINADGLTSKKQFEPENIVSYNELATVLSRLLYGVKYNYETVWYEKHVEQIEKIGLLSKNDLITIESVAKIFSIIYKNPSMIER